MYISVNIERCSGCGSCLGACPVAAIRVDDCVAIIGENCNLCGACVEACPFAAIVLERPRAEAPAAEAPGGVWVFAEQRRGVIHGVAFELLHKGRALADMLGTQLTAIIFGDGTSEMAAQLAERGADRIIAVEDPKLADFNQEICADLLTELAGEYKPEILLCGATAMGRSFFPRVAARLSTGLTADCTELDIDMAQRLLLQTRPAYGGNIMATIVCPGRRPQMATVRPRVFKKAPPAAGRKAQTIIRALDNERFTGISKVVSSVETALETVKLEDAEIIVSGGRGIGSAEKFCLMDDLAKALGAAVGASRAAVDAGWKPYAHQVGQTGKTVGPKLYIACGISGAIQHLVGMQSSDVIVAVNKDPEAPIFKVADIGLVGDLFQVIPRLITKLGENR